MDLTITAYYKLFNKNIYGENVLNFKFVLQLFDFLISILINCLNISNLFFIAERTTYSESAIPSIL